ncbi:MAG: hypothetical protein V4594_19325 [Bacteroidota bacterium]
MNKRSSTAQVSYMLGCILISVIAISLLMSTIGFALGVTVKNWYFPLSFLLTLALVYFLGPVVPEQKRLFAKSAVFSLLIISSSIVMMGYVYDVSHDGQTYHMETIYQLKNGWNIFRSDLPKTLDLSIFINHYTKGAEIPQSAIYSLTNKIECAKSTNIMLLAGTFFLVLSYLLSIEKVSIFRCWILSILCVLNPVSVTQLFSTYVDGQLAILLLALIITTLILTKSPGKDKLILLSFIIIVICNVKFTGLVYAVLFSVAFLTWLLITKNKLLFKQTIASIFISGVVAVCLTGFNPYLLNTIKHGHPFYPLMGKNKVDIMNHNTPPGLEDKSQLERFVTSLFSRTDNVNPANGRKIEVKIPFSINKKDIINAGKIDTRIAGFGPFFSGILLCAILLFLIVLIKKSGEKPVRNTLYMILAIFLSVMLMPESWWARYVPQLWYIPPGILILSEFILVNKQRLLKTILYFTLSVNISFTFIGLGWNILMSALISHQLNTLKASGEPIIVDWRTFNIIRVRFEENNINYIVKDLPNTENLNGLVRSSAVYIKPTKDVSLKKSKLTTWAEKFQQPGNE